MHHFSILIQLSILRSHKAYTVLVAGGDSYKYSSGSIKLQITLSQQEKNIYSCTYYIDLDPESGNDVTSVSGENTVNK